MAQPNRAPLAYFLRPRRAPAAPGGKRPSDSGSSPEHWDLLAFLSIAAKFGVDFSEETFRLGLRSLGRGATSDVVQSSLSKGHGLAFKVPTVSTASFSAGDTEKGEAKRLETLIYELVALESLRSNPFVVDLLGLTFHANIEFNQVLPVLLTEASTHGTLTRFALSAKGRNSTTTQRLKLCCNVAEACYGMHTLGIIHGDIKTDNVLVFEDEAGVLTAKVIDFGYSCFSTSPSAMVTVPRTKGWHAPEHELGKLFKWTDAQKMDLFSFGLLVCRLLVWEGLISTAVRKGLLPGEGGDLDTDLDAMADELKGTGRLLGLTLSVLDTSSNITGPEKEILRKVFSLTLDPDPGVRAAGFSEIISIIDPALKPKPFQFQPVHINKLSQEVIELGHILDDLDSVDYMVRQRLHRDLRRRVASHRGCVCFQPCAKQLWLCYEIGLGTEQNKQAAAKWRSRCTDITWNTQEYMELINRRYGVEKAARDDRMSSLIGYKTTSATTAMVKYRESGRLDEAETVCRRELEARKQSMGPQSRAYLAQLMLLSAILMEAGRPEDSLQAATVAAQTYKDAYGWNDHGTIGAYNYHVNMLFHYGAFEDAERLQLELLSIKRPLFDGKHRTSQSSKIMLAAIYHFQGRFDECLSEAKRLLDEQVVHLEQTHPDVLVTRFWICQARLVLGDNVNGLLKDIRQLVRDYESVVRADEDGALLAKELLARVLLAMAKPDPSTPVIEGYLDESLQILVVEVLNRIEDPDGVYSDAESEGSTQSSDVSMEDADSGSTSESEFDSQSRARKLENVSYTLLLVAYTTFICGLGFKFDFRNIHMSIPVVTSDKFVGRFPEGHLDLIRLKRVLPLVEKLESLAGSGITDGGELDQLLWALSHRWLLT